jgi:hypothetical protein
MDCANIAPYTPNDAWDSEFFWIRGFFITSADKPGAGPQLGSATAGEKLDLGVRVYNYCFAPMPEGTKVHVRFYGIASDPATSTSLGDSVSANNSFLIGETKLDPIPPFSDAPGAPLNWVIAHIPNPFDTTPYFGKSLVFWVVVWMQDANDNLVQEIEGHGLTCAPGTRTCAVDTLKSLADVPVEMGEIRQMRAATPSLTQIMLASTTRFSMCCRHRMSLPYFLTAIRLKLRWPVSSRQRSISARAKWI